MARTFSSEEHKAGLTLIVKPVDDPERPVDAEQFLQAATKWLASLASFASDSGLLLRWEIAELKQSSALLEVIPVDVRTGIIAASIGRDWKRVVSQIEQTGTPPIEVRPATIRDMEHFTSEGNNLAMVITTGDEEVFQPITVTTQRRMKEAVTSLPSEDYKQMGALRGSLAVLNSWNQDERWFRLRVPLAPDKQIRCTYADESLIGALGDTFEKTVDVTGLLHYKKTEVWPYLIEVTSIKKICPPSLDQFLLEMHPFNIPAGMDSVSYMRSLRDGD